MPRANRADQLDASVAPERELQPATDRSCWQDYALQQGDSISLRRLYKSSGNRMTNCMTFYVRHLGQQVRNMTSQVTAVPTHLLQLSDRLGLGKGRSVGR